MNIIVESFDNLSVMFPFLQIFIVSFDKGGVSLLNGENTVLQVGKGSGPTLMLQMLVMYLTFTTANLLPGHLDILLCQVGSNTHGVVSIREGETRLHLGLEIPLLEGVGEDGRMGSLKG